MQNIQREREESGKVQIGLLVALVLAAGALGAWSELKAAAQVEKNAGGSVYAESFTEDTSAWGEISDNGDGTAWVAVNYDNGTDWVQGVEGGATSYSINAEIKPGQSGRPGGSGSGIAQVAGMDLLSEEMVILDVTVSVAGTTESSAEVVQSVQVVRDPLTGESSINRVHRSGTSAVGPTAGSLAISVNDGREFTTSGGYGIVRAYTVNTVSRLR